MSDLVGLPLSHRWRDRACQKCEFGEPKPHLNRRGEEATWADWGLVANCHGRIQGPAGFLLTWRHFGPTPERRDDHADPFYESLEFDPPIVEAVDVEAGGGLRIGMTGGYSLTLYPMPDEEASLEEWRFMPPDDDLRGHLALGGDGLTWSRCPLRKWGIRFAQQNAIRGASAYNEGMTVDWNVPLRLGLAGLGTVVLCSAWFVARAALRQGVPRPWLVGLGVLFLLSALTTVGSQVTIVSKLSTYDPSDPRDE